jgi:copper chaperone CopZ
MNSLQKTVMTIVLLLSLAISNAQIKNAKTETAKIFGNCGICKTTIEKAGNLQKVAKVDWNKDTKIATLTYDSLKTNPDEILKRIALVGYDSEKFLAPDDVYSKLQDFCQYDREAKVAVPTDHSKMDMNKTDHSSHTTATEKPEINQLKSVFDNYFLLKDALVKSDGSTAAAISKNLLASLSDVKMDELSMDVHMVWIKVMKDLLANAKSISAIQDVKTQRANFMTLSKNIYELMKVAKTDIPVYYQYCPMVKANWLSKENTIKNPYYGSQMLSCGQTIETIKN